MSRSPRASRPLLRLAGLMAVALFLALVARFWHPVYGFTAFFQLDAANDDLKITPFRELPVFVHQGTGGYDGLYYAQIAHDPSLRDPELPRAMDNLVYRARRILPSALAWLLGAGRPAWIIHAYSLLNVAAWLALAAVLWRLLAVEDARGWLAWAGVLFSAGALSSVRLALTDLVALAIVAVALLAAERGRRFAAAGSLAAAGLARETSLLALAGLCDRPWVSKENLARVAVVVAPLAAWLVYIRWRVGPADQGWSNFTWPIAGLVEKLRADLAATNSVADKPLAWTTLLATCGLVMQAAFFIARPRLSDRWWRIGASYTVILLCLGTAVWEGFPGAATRVVLPLTLAFNVLAHRTRAPLAWLFAGNLTVFAGLLALRDIPSDPREIAAMNTRGVACVARAREGWFDREHHGQHTWLWSGGHGTLSLETWPKSNQTLQLNFTLRGAITGLVTIRQNGRDLSRVEVGSGFSPGSVAVTVANGHAAIEFATATPPIRENANPDARALAFALYDPRLALPKP